MPNFGFKHSEEAKRKISQANLGRKRLETLEETKKRLLNRCTGTEDSKGCWMWQGAQFGKTGYGQIQYRGKPRRVHRLAWTLFVGKIPDGMLVCHHCDNRLCANPDHLFIGTQLDNVRDMRRKGRENYPKGNQLPVAKLNPEKVRMIRKMYESGTRVCDLARMFGVTHCPICCVIKRRTWKHVD